MADLFELEGFDYIDSTQVKEEALQLSRNKSSFKDVDFENFDDSQITTHWQYTPYVTDSVTRRASALQKTNIGMIDSAFVSEATAKKLGIGNDDLYLGVPVSIVDSVAEDYVFVHTNQARKA